MIYKFKIIPFIISLIVGLIYVWITRTPIKNVIRMPTPYNYKEVVYTDEKGDCYMFDIEEVECN